MLRAEVEDCELSFAHKISLLTLQQLPHLQFFVNTGIQFNNVRN